MGLFDKLMSSLGRKRVIMDRSGKVPYLYRYYMFFKGKINEFEESPDYLFNIIVHHIVLSDESDMHDHPWTYFTLILWGGYWEHTPDGQFWRGPGHFRFSAASSRHRLELPFSTYAGQQPSAWTLFIHGPKIRTWGFYTSKGWVDWKTYIARRYGISSGKVKVKFGKPIPKKRGPLGPL